MLNALYAGRGSCITFILTHNKLSCKYSLKYYLTLSMGLGWTQPYLGPQLDGSWPAFSYPETRRRLAQDCLGDWQTSFLIEGFGFLLDVG